MIQETNSHLRANNSFQQVLLEGYCIAECLYGDVGVSTCYMSTLCVGYIFDGLTCDNLHACTVDTAFKRQVGV